MITYTCILIYKTIAINKNIIFKTNQKIYLLNAVKLVYTKADKSKLDITLQLSEILSSHFESY